MDVNFEYYKFFYYAAKYGNITRAAAAMQSNQPNVTRVLKLLETELQCKLFIREARGVRLTEAGERLYAHVEVAFRQLQDAQEELSAQLQDEAGTVEIGATELALHLFLLDELQQFKEHYPKVRIRIHNDPTPKILRELGQGGLDLAVVTTPFEVGTSWNCYDLMEFREILAGGRQYAHLSKNIWKLRELKEYPWISLGKDTATRQNYDTYFLEHGVEIEPDLEVATSDLIIPLIKSNFGIGFVSEELAKPWIESGELSEIPIESRRPVRKTCLVYDRARGRNAAAEELRKYLIAGAGTEK